MHWYILNVSCTFTLNWYHVYQLSFQSVSDCGKSFQHLSFIHSASVQPASSWWLLYIHPLNFVIKYDTDFNTYLLFGCELFRLVELPKLPETLPVMLTDALPAGRPPCIDVDLYVTQQQVKYKHYMTYWNTQPTNIKPHIKTKSSLELRYA